MICRRKVTLRYGDWLRLLDQCDTYAAWREFYALWLGYASTAQLTGLDAMQCEADYHLPYDEDDYVLIYEICS